VFDPLAVCMILAGNTGIAVREEKKQTTNADSQSDSQFAQIEKKKIMNIDPKSTEGHNLEG